MYTHEIVEALVKQIKATTKFSLEWAELMTELARVNFDYLRAMQLEIAFPREDSVLGPGQQFIEDGSVILRGLSNANSIGNLVPANDTRESIGEVEDGA